MKTVIMAGGKGTRISSVASDIPKPMIPVDNKPVLEHQINSLRKQGFDEFLITVSYLGSQIIDYFGDGSNLGVNIQYFNESTPLGNAGALFKLRDQLTDDFLLLNGDLIFDVNFERFIKYHQRSKGVATVFTHPNNHPYDSSLLIADQNGAAKAWFSKENIRPKWCKNRVNAGLHIINPIALDMTGIEPDLVGTRVNGQLLQVDLDRDVLAPLCGTELLFCYDSPEYVKDMGTPERYKAVCEDFSSGLVKMKNLEQKQKAIFLDRDGTVNRYVGFLRNIDDFSLLSGVAEAIKMINNSSYLSIVVTNQPVIARGEVSVEQLQEIHNKMETLLGDEGAYLDAIYYCPHHPHKGYEGEISELKVDCDCRKPKQGMFLKAAEDFNIDLSQSWMIGDSENDIKAGIAAGCKTILLGKEREYGQDRTASTLWDAVNTILKT